MKKLFVLLFAFVANVGIVSAAIISHVQIGDLFYVLDDSTYVAQVEAQDNMGRDNYPNLTTVNVPSQVTYNNEPYTVNAILSYAFYKCSGLVSVTLPESLEIIDASAFRDCTGLTAIDLPNGIVYFGAGVFYGCTGLTSVELPDSLRVLNNMTFRECTALTTVIIKDSVREIGSGVFRNCTSLTSVYNYASTPQQISTSAFAGVDLTPCTLYVPAASVTAYQNNDIWNAFGSIVGMTNQEETDLNVNYIDNNSELLGTETVTLHLPEAPEIEGFTFLKWQVAGGDLEDGIYIQAVYTANSEGTPAVYTNPTNSAQKLIRKGNVYILRDDKTYTLTGQEVK